MNLTSICYHPAEPRLASALGIHADTINHQFIACWTLLCLYLADIRALLVFTLDGVAEVLNMDPVRMAPVMNINIHSGDLTHQPEDCEEVCLELRSAYHAGRLSYLRWTRQLVRRI